MAVKFVDSAVRNPDNGSHTTTDSPSSGRRPAQENVHKGAAMQTTNERILTENRTHLLTAAIRANAGFTALSAAGLILFSEPIARFFGPFSPAIFTGVGIVLALYVPFLLWTAGQSPVPRLLAWTIIELDLLWIAASAYLIFSDAAALTPGGKWAIAAVADIVAVFAVLQFIGLRRQQRDA